MLNVYIFDIHINDCISKYIFYLHIYICIYLYFINFTIIVTQVLSL